MGNNLAFEFLHELDGIAEIADLGMKLGGSGVIGRIADGEQSAERDVFGQTERIMNLIGVEPSDPAGADAELPRFEHHMSANDRRVGFAGAITGGEIVFPSLVVIVADGENDGRVKGEAADGGELFAHFVALDHVDLLRLLIAGGGRNATRFEDRQ